MTQKRTILLGVVAANLWLVSGCATSSQPDLSNLPPEATIDDGIDHYSTDIGTEELTAFRDDQWTTDEDGNRVYYLNSLRIGNTNSYYVGDLRYLPPDSDTEQTGYATFQNRKIPVDRAGGSALRQMTLRGGRNGTYYQTRRGRIAYLPNRQTEPDQTDPGPSNSETNNTPTPQSDDDAVRPATRTTPRPRPRPSRATPRPTRSSPPPRPQRQSQPRDNAPRRVNR